MPDKVLAPAAGIINGRLVVSGGGRNNPRPPHGGDTDRSDSGREVSEVTHRTRVGSKRIAVPPLGSDDDVPVESTRSLLMRVPNTSLASSTSRRPSESPSHGHRSAKPALRFGRMGCRHQPGSAAHPRPGMPYCISPSTLAISSVGFTIRLTRQAGSPCIRSHPATSYPRSIKNRSACSARTLRLRALEDRTAPVPTLRVPRSPAVPAQTPSPARWRRAVPAAIRGRRVR